MQLRRLWLSDFRSYAYAELAPAPGLTAIVGSNGEGKTNLVEAIAWLATMSSFRGVPNDALVRDGAERAIVRGDVVREGRELLVEAEIPRRGASRVQLNRQRLARSRDLLGALRVSVFTPDDLVLVKGGPAERRRVLDELVVALDPKLDAVRTDLDRVLRQRAALLRQCGGHLRGDDAVTLSVWDERLADLGTRWGEVRAATVQALAPGVAQAYADVAGAALPVVLEHDPTWLRDGYGEALARSRDEDLRRAMTTVGPHRDDVVVVLDGRPARTHASQGEQRSLSLAIRLAGHRLVADRLGTAPLLVLDDVFSELDPQRSAALLVHLPPGQAILTTASVLPPSASPELTVRVEGHQLR